jgi:hypothetical protein
MKLNGSTVKLATLPARLSLDYVLNFSSSEMSILDVLPFGVK